MVEGYVAEVFRVTKFCRNCMSEKLDPVIDFGDVPQTWYSNNQLEPGLNLPLGLIVCLSCGMVQATATVNTDVLYGKHYWYQSGLNGTMREHLQELAHEAEFNVQPVAGDIVLDIGANDATLLEAYRTPDLERLGFEPSTNIAQMVAERRSPAHLFWETFNPRVFHHYTKHRDAKIITAIAMFYDVDEPNEFLQGIAEILANDGVFILQMNDLYSMLKHSTFDIICHEHVAYYTVSLLSSMLAKVGLEIFKVRRYSLNGGSMRYLIRHKSDEIVDFSVAEEVEKEENFFEQGAIGHFAAVVLNKAIGIREAVEQELNVGGKVYLYGASTRGNTILAATQLTSKEICGAAEIHPEKIGKFMVGTGIVIVTEEAARRDATAFLVLPYSYIDEIVVREEAFLGSGGKLIVPLPEVRVIDDSTT
jgi:NDP-4-keto-2,6-dideoxyhexose 3-C-methyltransferase